MAKIDCPAQELDCNFQMGLPEDNEASREPWAEGDATFKSRKLIRFAFYGDGG